MALRAGFLGERSALRSFTSRVGGTTPGTSVTTRYSGVRRGAARLRDAAYRDPAWPADGGRSPRPLRETRSTGPGTRRIASTRSSAVARSVRRRRGSGSPRELRHHARQAHERHGREPVGGPSLFSFIHRSQPDPKRPHGRQEARQRRVPRTPCRRVARRHALGDRERLVWGDERPRRALRGAARRGGALDLAVFDALPDAIGVVWPTFDAAGALVDFEVGYTNPSSERMMGVRLGDEIGARLRDAMPGVWCRRSNASTGTSRSARFQHCKPAAPGSSGSFRTSSPTRSSSATAMHRA